MSLFRSRFISVPKNRKFEYSPRYYDAEAEERKEILEQNIKLERGAFYKGRNRSRLVGAFTEKEVVFRKQNRNQQTKRTFLLIIMLTLPCFYIGGFLSGGFSAFLFVALLIAFINQVNKF